MTKNTFLVTFLFIVAIGLSACSNTFEGAGEDMESAGKWVQDTF